jgi:hypothetical protein
MLLGPVAGEHCEPICFTKRPILPENAAGALRQTTRPDRQ